MQYIVAICGLAFSTWLQLGILSKVDIKLTILIFIMIFSFYNYANMRREMWKERITLVLMPVLLMLFYYDVEVVFLFSLVGIVSLNYPRNIVWKGFRQVKGIKIFIIAMVWTTVMLIPIYIAGETGEGHNLYRAAMMCIFFFFSLALPFDIKTLYTDPSNMKTLPQQWGIKKTKMVGTLSLGISCYFSAYFEHTFFLSFLLACLYLLILLWGSFPEMKNRYFYFYVEITPCIGLIVYLLLRFLQK